MCVPVLSLGVATLTLDISLITITNETRRQYNPQIPMFKILLNFLVLTLCQYFDMAEHLIRDRSMTARADVSTRVTDFGHWPDF